MPTKVWLPLKRARVAESESEPEERPLRVAPVKLTDPLAKRLVEVALLTFRLV